MERKTQKFVSKVYACGVVKWFNFLLVPLLLHSLSRQKRLPLSFGGPSTLAQKRPAHTAIATSLAEGCPCPSPCSTEESPQFLKYPWPVL